MCNIFSIHLLSISRRRCAAPTVFERRVLYRSLAVASAPYGTVSSLETCNLIKRISLQTTSTRKSIDESTWCGARQYGETQDNNELSPADYVDSLSKDYEKNLYYPGYPCGQTR